MFTDKLFESVRPMWESYLSHPFVCGIGDGTLPKEKFQYYMIQDYIYLYDYARVFALGAAKAKDHNLMRMFASLLDSTLNGEMNIHKSYMERLDITEAMIAKTPAALTNSAYTSYMLKIAYEGNALDILIAVLACAWSYEYIGRALLEKNPEAAEHPFYGEWIEGYTCESYLEGNMALMAMINTFGETIDQETYDRLEEIFVTCSRFEAMFWDMAWQMGDTHADL